MQPNLIWRPSHNFSLRSSPVDLLVVSTTESPYDDAVSFYCDSQSRVSAHYVVNETGTEVTQLVDVTVKAWHAAQFSSRSVAIKVAGYARDGIRDEAWLTAATMVTCLLHYLQLPMRWARNAVGPGYCRFSDLPTAANATTPILIADPIWEKFQATVEAAYWQADYYPPVVAPDNVAAVPLLAPPPEEAS